MISSYATPEPNYWTNGNLSSKDLRDSDDLDSHNGDNSETFNLTQLELTEAADLGLVMELSEFMATSLQESWKTMIPSSGDEQFPTKVSENFNPNEPYWQLMFSRTACRLTEEDDTEPNAEESGLKTLEWLDDQTY